MIKYLLFVLTTFGIFETPEGYRVVYAGLVPARPNEALENLVPSIPGLTGRSARNDLLAENPIAAGKGTGA